MRRPFICGLDSHRTDLDMANVAVSLRVEHWCVSPPSLATEQVEGNVKFAGLWLGRILDRLLGDVLGRRKVDHATKRPPLIAAQAHMDAPVVVEYANVENEGQRLRVMIPAPLAVGRFNKKLSGVRINEPPSDGIDLLPVQALGGLFRRAGFASVVALFPKERGGVFAPSWLSGTCGPRTVRLLMLRISASRWRSQAASASGLIKRFAPTL